MTMRLAPALAPAALAAATAAAAAAETVVSPAEFAEYAEGYRLTFEKDGAFAGAESFGPDGRVTWQTPEGVCLEGLMRAYGDRFCFYYGIGADVQCWHVLRDDEGLKVRSLDGGPGPAGLTYRITGRDRQPLSCQGPGRDTRHRPDGALSPRAPRPARW